MTTKKVIIIGLVLLLILLAIRPMLEKQLVMMDHRDYLIDFIDDSGYRIKMDRPAERIISLYSAHTENLFALGLDREIIGVGTSDVYPIQVLEKTVYDYKSDPEKVLAANPDLVVIRPFIERHSPDFVKTLRRTGITVVSLYPESFDEFDAYIMKLAMLTGKEITAEQRLKVFHDDLEKIRKQAEGNQVEYGVYFESSDREYKTVTEDSMPAKAIELIGARNVATDAKAIEEGSSIAVYGLERIIEKGKEIDYFVTQRGVMGAGGNLHSISIRPGFDVVKAVQEGHVIEISQKLISSPTFRFVEGVKALRRVIYEDVPLMNDGAVTRRGLSRYMMTKFKWMPYVPTSSYFRGERDRYYGDLLDVNHEDPDFLTIETILQKGLLDLYLTEEGYMFRPDQAVTREELATIIYLLKDLKNIQMDILDQEDLANKRIVESVVGNGWMTLDQGFFKPEEAVSWHDVQEVFND
jgi:iron complex transport system substrate-binding protein